MINTAYGHFLRFVQKPLFNTKQWTTSFRYNHHAHTPCAELERSLVVMENRIHRQCSPAHMWWIRGPRDTTWTAMELALDVEHSVAIKRKKPWPKFAWLEGVNELHVSYFLIFIATFPPFFFLSLQTHSSHGLYMLDQTRVSQLFLATGKTRRRFSSLSAVDRSIVLTTHSPSGERSGHTVCVPAGSVGVWKLDTWSVCPSRELWGGGAWK